MAAVTRGPQPQHMQQYEYLLFGSVQERDVPALLHRLRGLCDYATTGGLPFTDKEITYRIGAAPHAISKVKVRQALDMPDAPWHLIYSGQLELGDSHRPAAVRTCTVATCTHNLPDFLRELGFIAVSELILKGFIFRKGQIKVSVFKLLQPTEVGDADSAQPFSPHHLVELSAITPSSVDTTGSEVKAFAEQLKPIVTMEKTDGGTR